MSPCTTTGGGRDAEMTFGLGEVEYQEMYIHNDDGDAALLIGILRRD